MRVQPLFVLVGLSVGGCFSQSNLKDFTSGVSSVNTSLDDLDVFRETIVVRAEASKKLFETLYPADLTQCPRLEREANFFKFRHDAVDSLSKFAKGLADILDTSAFDAKIDAGGAVFNGLVGLLGFSYPPLAAAETGVIDLAKIAARLKANISARKFVKLHREEVKSAIKRLKDGLRTADADVMNHFNVWNGCESGHFNKILREIRSDGHSKTVFGSDYRAFRKDYEVLSRGLEKHRYSDLNKALTKMEAAFDNLESPDAKETIAALQSAADDLKKVYEDWQKLNTALAK